jgi:hypothetical protein
MRINILTALALGMAATGMSVAHASPLLAVTGTYSIGYTPTANNAPSISDVLSSPFTENLAVGTPTALTNFIAITPAGSCTSVQADVYGSHYSTCTATGTVKVTFSFTEPSGIIGTASDTGVYTATYYTGNGAPADTDSIVWNSPDPIVVNFSDGALLDVTLENTSDWTLTPKITFDLMKDPTAVPEPMTLGLLGAGLFGIGVIKRRSSPPA